MKELRKTVNKQLAQLESARETVRSLRKDLRKTRHRVSDILEAQDIAQRVAEEVQQFAHERLAEIVSRCLTAVFDEPYEFRIHFERKRGRTEARLVFERDGLEVDPLSASGGGVVDVAAFALRLACLSMSRPPLRRLLVLDEPFKFVSSGFRSSVRDLLGELSRELGVQILLVTHIPEIVPADSKVFTLP